MDLDEASLGEASLVAVVGHRSTGNRQEGADRSLSSRNQSPNLESISKDALLEPECQSMKRGIPCQGICVGHVAKVTAEGTALGYLDL